MRTNPTQVIQCSVGAQMLVFHSDKTLATSQDPVTRLRTVRLVSVCPEGHQNEAFYHPNESLPTSFYCNECNQKF